MARKTILIVDDSLVARMVTKKILANLRPDWAVLEAKDVENAREVIGREAVDGVLLDYTMPGLSGMDLGISWRGEFPDLVIFMLTANIQAPVKAQADEHGIGFVEKPATTDKLIPFIEACE